MIKSELKEEYYNRLVDTKKRIDEFKRSSSISKEFLLLLQKKLEIYEKMNDFLNKKN